MKKQIFKLQSLIMLLLLVSGGFLYAAAFNYNDEESRPINLREQLPKGPITQEVAREIYYSFPEFHGLTVPELNEHLQKVVSEPEKNMRKSAAVGLIEAGADIECESFGVRILGKAIHWDDVPLADYLLSKGAIGDYLYYGDPIFWRSESLKMLMLFKKFDFGKTNKAGKSIVHYIIAMRMGMAHDENYAMLENILRNCSFLVNHVDSWGCTPLCKIVLHYHQDDERTLKQVQLFIDHGARRSHRITKGFYAGRTAAQIKPKSKAAAFISSSYAPTLYETIVRALLERERSADKATADQAKDDLATALLPTQAPDAFYATLHELRERLKNTSDEVEQQQLAHDIKSLEFLAVTRYEGRQPLAELIAEYREEHCVPVSVSQPAPVGEGAQ